MGMTAKCIAELFEFSMQGQKSLDLPIEHDQAAFRATRSLANHFARRLNSSKSTLRPVRYTLDDKGAIENALPKDRHAATVSA